MSDDARTTVRALLAASGIAPSAAEVEAMILGYPALRAAADALYADAIARHAPTFLPTDAIDGTDGILATRPTDGPAASRATR